MIKELPIKITFKEERIVDALTILGDIYVNKDEIKHLSKKDVDAITLDVIKEIIIALKDTILNDDKCRIIVDNFIEKSNIRFLLREKPTKAYMH